MKIQKLFFPDIFIKSGSIYIKTMLKWSPAHSIRH